jgi:hypothetical protein
MSNVSNQSANFDDEEHPINAPHTDELAVVKGSAQVNGVLAIRIYRGSYRNAVIHDEIFEIGDVKMPFDSFKGVLRVQVNCRWYGWEPKHSHIHLTLDGDWQLLQSYTGLVSRDFGRA